MLDDASADGQWVTIGRVAGNCGASSAPTTIAGFDTRLVYRSDATQFQVFLIDQSDPNSSGGSRTSNAGPHAPMSKISPTRPGVTR